MYTSYEIQPHDEALDAFRQAFDMPLLNCQVSDDGKEMRYRVNIDRVAARALLLANHVIKSAELPLSASVEEFKVKGVRFGMWLQIRFEPSKSLLPCY